MTKGLFMEKEIKYFKEAIRKEITDSRLEHSFRVAEIAKSISERVSYPSPEKAYLAGLIHDITKQKPKEFHKEIFKKWKFHTYKELPKPAYHAFSAVFYLKENYKFKDQEVLSAIQNHTLGSMSMNVLDKIIYASDFLGSEYAISQDDYQTWLHSTLENLDFGIYLKSSKTIQDLIYKKKKIHSLTIRIYNSTLDKI